MTKATIALTVLTFIAATLPSIAAVAVDAYENIEIPTITERPFFTQSPVRSENTTLAQGWKELNKPIMKLKLSWGQEKMIQVMEGQEFTVEMYGNPTTGFTISKRFSCYRQRLATKQSDEHCVVPDNVLTLKKESITPINFHPGVIYVPKVGVGSNYLFEYVATRPGLCGITFLYERAWSSRDYVLGGETYLGVAVQNSKDKLE